MSLKVRILLIPLSQGYAERLLVDHPYFVGLQAHPEFCTRPLNPSPPFLGFVAAASGPQVLEEQLTSQLASFKPPHPNDAMVSEDALKNKTPELLPPGKEVLLTAEQ